MNEPRTLVDVCADFWQARLYVLTGLIVGCVAAALFVFTATPYYKAHMIVSPANPMNGAEVSSLLADDNLFALRYLMQRVGVGNSSDFLRFENTYAGSSVAKELLGDEKILTGLASDRRFRFSPAKRNWSAEELAEYIGKHVRLEPVGATSLRRMVYSHPSREYGTYFLKVIHSISDGLIRTNIRQEATQRVNYLQQAIKATGNPEHRRALTTLLLEQERLRMLVSIETPYAAAVVEPPAAGVKPSWPDALLLFPVFMFIGGLIGFVVHGFKEAVRAQPLRQAMPIKWRQLLKKDSKNTNKKPSSSRYAAE